VWVRIGRCLIRQHYLRRKPRGAKAAALYRNARSRGLKQYRNLTTPETSKSQPLNVYDQVFYHLE